MRGEILNSEYELSVLNQREAELAKAQGDKRKQKGDYFLVFCLGEGANEKYALSYQYIEKVVALNVLTVIPGVPDFFLGVTYHNTEVWPVINTEKLLNISCKKNAARACDFIKRWHVSLCICCAIYFGAPRLGCI